MAAKTQESAERETKTTPFTEWLKHAWDASGLTQTAFVQALGLDPVGFGSQTMSKFIHGRYASIPPDLLEAVARRSGVDEAKLRALHRGDPVELLPAAEGWAKVLLPSDPLEAIRRRVRELEDERRALQIKLERNDAALEELRRLLPVSS